MNNFYRKLVTALQFALTHIQCMLTHANTSFSNSAVQHKQHEYCAIMLPLLETCTLEILDACVVYYCIHVIVMRVGLWLIMYITCTNFWYAPNNCFSVVRVFKVVTEWYCM